MPTIMVFPDGVPGPILSRNEAYSTLVLECKDKTASEPWRSVRNKFGGVVSMPPAAMTTYLLDHLSRLGQEPPIVVFSSLAPGDRFRGAQPLTGPPIPHRVYVKLADTDHEKNAVMILGPGAGSTVKVLDDAIVVPVQP